MSPKKPKLPRKAGLLIWALEETARYQPSELLAARAELDKYIVHLIGKIRRRDATIRKLRSNT